MISLLPSFKVIPRPYSHKNYKTHQSFRVIACSFSDEGKPRNIVDANLRVLRERMEEVKMKERSERCCPNEQYGWNYSHSYNYKSKREANLSQFYQLITLVGTSICLPILSGTFLLCLVSFITHLNQ